MTSLARAICPRQISERASFPIFSIDHTSRCATSRSSHTMPMTYEHLIIDTSQAGVQTITLNRPERLNAVNPRLADELPRAIDDAARDDAVRVIVLTGAGRGFCSGLDLSEPPRLPEGSLRERLDPL